MLNLESIFRGEPGATPRIRSILGLILSSLTVETTFSAPGLKVGINPLVDGAAVAVDASLEDTHVITCVNNNVRVIQVPTNGVTGQRIVVRIINASGGAIGNTSFVAGILKPAVTLPATGFQRDYILAFDGTTWRLYVQSAADVPNT